MSLFNPANLFCMTSSPSHFAGISLPALAAVRYRTAGAPHLDQRAQVGDCGSCSHAPPECWALDRLRRATIYRDRFCGSGRTGASLYMVELLYMLYIALFISRFCVLLLPSLVFPGSMSI